MIVFTFTKQEGVLILEGKKMHLSVLVISITMQNGDMGGCISELLWAKNEQQPNQFLARTMAVLSRFSSGVFLYQQIFV